MRISKGGWIALALALAACQPAKGLPTLPALSLLTPTQTVTVRDGAVRIAGPTDYCPDRSSLRETESSAAILLGRCSAESEAPPAVLTVSVGARGSSGVMTAGGAALAAFLASEAGRASVSRRGRAGDVTIGTALMAEGVFLARIEDKAVGNYWRAMLPVAGYLVSVSATGPNLPPPEGRKLVEAAAKALQRANRP